MPQVDVRCSQCRSGEYELLDDRTGEVICRYCRNKWVVPELIHKTETEKFLEEQAKRPRIVMDNSTETDKQLMDMFGKVLNFNPMRSFSNIFRIAITVIVIIVILMIVLLGFGMLNSFDVLNKFFG